MRISQFCVFVQPTYWQFWPLWEGPPSYDSRRRIYIGPLVIQWHVTPPRTP